MGRFPPALTLLGSWLAVWLPTAAAALDRAADASAARPVIAVDVRGGAVTLLAENAPLVEVLTRIGQEAGFRVVVTGDLERATTQSFQNVPVPAALKRLAGDLSYLMIFEDRAAGAGAPVLREIKLYASGRGAVGRDAGGRRADAAPRLEMPNLDHLSAAGRRSAVRDLARPGGEAALAEILRNNPDPDVRSQAATALGRLGQETAVPALAAAVSDSHPVVQLRAVRALDEIGGARAAQVLKAVAHKSENQRVRAAAAQAADLVE